MLDPKTLAAIRDLPLVARQVVDGFLHGRHASLRSGAGQEFSQYRSYQPGDDLRRVDWKLYARSDRFYVREAEVETSTHVRFVLDASASMQHAEDGLSKFDYARFLTAALAYLADRQGDGVGLHVVRDGGIETLPPQHGPQHLRRLMHRLEQAEPAGVWPGWSAVEGVLAEARREVVVCVTDLHEQADEIREALVHLRALRNEVLILHVLGRREQDFAYDGSVELEDLETGRTVQVDAQRAGRTYRAALERHLKELRHTLRDEDIGYDLFSMDEPLDRALRTYLTRRQRRG